MKIDLSPSAASRWTVCTASPSFIAQNAERIPSQDTKYNVEGTLAHQTAEAILRGHVLPKGATADMVKHGTAYAQFCDSLIDPLWNEIVKSEQKLPLWYMEGRNGYVDFVSLNKDTLHIVDYKYGAGVEVSAENNLQMAIYARNALIKFVPTIQSGQDRKLKVAMHIHQPRIRREDGGSAFSTWELPWIDLWEFTSEKVEEWADIILDHASGWKSTVINSVVKFAPSNKTCQFCPAASFCKARADWLISDLTDLDELLTTGQASASLPATLSDDQISKILHARKGIEKWLDTIYEYAMERAKARKPVKGWKLVNGKGSRSWINETEAETFMDSLMLGKKPPLRTESKLISPHQAEELFPHVKFDPFIRKFDGAPTLAPEDDKRAPYGSSVVEMFDDLENPENLF